MLNTTVPGDLMFARSLAFVLVLSAPATTLAGEVDLPAGLEWCADTGDVLLALPDVQMLSEGVIEGEARAFGLRGTLTMLTDSDQLNGVRFRCFDTDANLAALKQTFNKRHGEGTTEDRTREGGDRRLKIEWEVDAKQSLSMKVNSEQIYVAWEVDPDFCTEETRAQEGLTDAEKADIEATTKKKAIAFDPFAEDIEDVDARKKASDDAKKSEEERKEEAEKKEEKPPTDVEIDW